MSVLTPLEPDGKDPDDGFPIYDGALIRVPRLSLELTKEPPGIRLPCWIDCGESRTKITPETAKPIGYALLLAFEMMLAQKNNPAEDE